GRHAPLACPGPGSRAARLTTAGTPAAARATAGGPTHAATAAFRGGRARGAGAGADDDREGGAGGVVVDAFEPGADQLIDLGQAADLSQSELHVDVHLLGHLKQSADRRAQGDRRGLVVEVRRVEDDR